MSASSNAATVDTLEAHRLVRETRPPAHSDADLALRFVREHGRDLKYVAAWNSWLEWDGIRWRPERTLKAIDLSRQVCCRAAAECWDPSDAARLASKATIFAVCELTKAHRQIATSTEQWDLDPSLLNTPAGTLDLRSGELLGHRRGDFITKVTAASSGGPSDRWLSFLDQATRGDRELKAYLRRMAGYMLTGSVEEHALFFAFGNGANGKSTFTSTLSGMMGSYATIASMDVLTECVGERHPTEIANLRGARLVTACEAEGGRRWAESRIKVLTGGTNISARFMRCDYFEFKPTFKLLVEGNHLPGLRGVDEAIRRRMHIIPFIVTVPVEQRDTALKDRLAEEWPGILEWAIAGCLEWRNAGLARPAAVDAATASYLETEDCLGAWIAERCLVVPYARAAIADLFRSFDSWARASGEPPCINNRTFSQMMHSRGFMRCTVGRSGAKGFEGITIKDADRC